MSIGRQCVCLILIAILAMSAPTASATSLEFIANFATGELQIVNTGVTTVNLTAYSIDSDAGALVPGNWLTIADNYDASNNQTVDTNDDWNVLLQTMSTFLEVEEDGDGGFILPGQTVDLGLAWNPLIAQDLEIQYLDGAVPVLVTPDYRSYAADFNEDLRVDADDLALWEAGFGTTSGAQLLDGDADRDGDVDPLDFYIWLDQVGLVSPLLPAVTPVAFVRPTPEPSSLLLLGMSLSAFAWASLSRRRSVCFERGPR